MADPRQQAAREQATDPALREAIFKARELNECKEALNEVERAYRQMDDRRAAIELQLVDAFDYIRRLEDLLRWRVDRQQARDEFLALSVAVWREIDRLSNEYGTYPGLPQSTELRKREKAAWERYRATLDGES